MRESHFDSIVLGGGCFWCTEAVFAMLKSVVSIEPGYAGGSLPNPTYEQVCHGNTGHAEVVKITYNPSLLPLKDIFTVFFATHDPTTKDRQGNDIGSQYRSIILCQDRRQEESAKKFIEAINRSTRYGKPVVTEVAPLKAFYPAEEHHKDYYKRNAGQPYCQAVINPKLKKVQERFYSLLNDKGRRS